MNGHKSGCMCAWCFESLRDEIQQKQREYVDLWDSKESLRKAILIIRDFIAERHKPGDTEYQVVNTADRALRKATPVSDRHRNPVLLDALERTRKHVETMTPEQVQEFVDSEADADADKQPTCCGDATHGCMGLPAVDSQSDPAMDAAIEAESRLIDLTEGLLELADDIQHWVDCPCGGDGIEQDCNCPSCEIKRLVSAATSQERDDG